MIQPVPATPPPSYHPACFSRAYGDQRYADVVRDHDTEFTIRIFPAPIRRVCALCGGANVMGAWIEREPYHDAQENRTQA